MTQRQIVRMLQVSVGVLLGLAAALWWVSASGAGPEEASPPESHFLPAPLPVPPFTLTSQEDRPVSSDDFPGKALVVFFGYTSCPDICPLILTHLTQAFRLMEEEGERVQVLLVTVDPDRDTPERLRRYLRNFHPSFLGLTGTEEEIRSVAGEFGAYFARVGEGENYTVDHTARSFVLDSEGRIALTFPISATPDEMARDLNQLLDRNRE